MTSQVIELIARVKADPSMKERLTDDSHLIYEASLDSLQIINLVLLVENEFNVEVDFDSFEIKHLSSVRSFSEYIASLSKA